MKNSTSGLNRNNSIANLNAVTQEPNEDIVSQQLDPDTLILFGRCDREKEEWFKLFKKSSKKLLLDSNQYAKLYKSTTNTNINASSGASSIRRTVSFITPDCNSFSCDTSTDKIIYKINSEKEASSDSLNQDADSNATGGLNGASKNTVSDYFLNVVL
jgi:hypothetical protein